MIRTAHNKCRFDPSSCLHPTNSIPQNKAVYGSGRSGTGFGGFITGRVGSGRERALDSTGRVGNASICGKRGSGKRVTRTFEYLNQPTLNVKCMKSLKLSTDIRQMIRFSMFTQQTNHRFTIIKVDDHKSVKQATSLQ